MVELGYECSSTTKLWEWGDSSHLARWSKTLLSEISQSAHIKWCLAYRKHSVILLTWLWSFMEQRNPQERERAMTGIVLTYSEWGLVPLPCLSSGTNVLSHPLLRWILLVRLVRILLVQLLSLSGLSSFSEKSFWFLSSKPVCHYKSSSSSFLAWMPSSSGSVQ